MLGFVTKIMSKEFILEKTYGNLSRVRTSQLIHALSDITCGENCWNAKEEICRCECGGKNHGIHLRGENAVRACRINGRRYELVSVGKHADLFRQAQALIRERDIESGKAFVQDGVLMERSTYTGIERIIRYSPPVRLDCIAPYELKYASLPQCLKWKELAYFEIADDRDRYHSNAAILWKREDVPTY